MTGRRLLPGSLRFRVTALAALAVLGVLTAVGTGVVLTHRAVLIESLDEGLGDRAETIAGQVRSGRAFGRGDLPTDDVLAQVVGADGTVLAASPGLGDVRLGSGVPERTTVTDGRFPDGGQARVVAAPAGAAAVYVAGSLEDVERSTGTLVGSLLVAVPLSSAALAALVWWLVGRVLRPVEDIRAEVDRISARRLDRRVPEPSTPDEVARLARTMNAMLDRLAAAAAEQRRFVADAAHELRSPLARIRAQLEVDAAHPGSADPRATHASVLDETVRLQRLVDDLLLLARGDAGALDLDRAGPVDLDHVVEGLVRGRGAQDGPRIETRGVGAVQVRGDAAQLARAVGNLLDNAVRHARSTVTVHLAEDDGGRAVLTVADDGPGIPAADRERVFDRFTRLDEARSADGGAGLGLAIVRDIAQRHGGTLTLETAAPEGARFAFTLPGDGVSAASPPGRA
ncbi:MAG TPA: HAMP domain-containing sensor histidine kinase [Blastococcus sp.]|nr:HAMP domain-containing sensor histidine kinase [Blastococcus sp.]